LGIAEMRVLCMAVKQRPNIPFMSKRTHRRAKHPIVLLK
jgi:hypothetical protein